MYMHYLGPPSPLPPPFFFFLGNYCFGKKNTPVQWEDGVGPPVVPGSPGHRHQQVAKKVAKKGPRVARVGNLNKMLANGTKSK